VVDRDKLLACRIFDDLKIEELGAVLACGKELRFRDNEVILHESSVVEGSDLFIIAEGMVKVQVGSERKDGTISNRLAILRKGDVFGEMGFLKGRRRSAQVVAYGDELQVIRISAEKLYDLFEKNNHIGYLIMQNLASILSDRLVDVNFMLRDDI
jgi:CRP-like cAMP-binding protein